MLQNLFENTSFSEETLVMITIGLMLALGFLGSRITKLLKLPNVSAYIIVGVVLGPSLLNIFPTSVLDHMEFVTDIALSFIAFGVGGFFTKDILKKSGKNVIVITLFESIMTIIVVFIFAYFIFQYSLSFSLILASIASSTAPASTIMTIKQYKAEGKFVSTLLQVVALDDIVALLAYSVAIAIGTSAENGTFSALSVIIPIASNIGMVVAGFALGLLLTILFKKIKKDDYRLILTLAVIFLNGAVCSMINVSPLLSCIALGTSYINFAKDDHLFNQIDTFSAPVLMLFFLYSGTKLTISAITTVGVIGVIYFFIRIVSKYAGASLGSVIVHEDKKVTKYLGLALIPQAGVSIGLATMGSRVLPAEMGSLLMAIILSSSILYELVGPTAAKLSLYLTKSYDVDKFRKPKKHRRREFNYHYTAHPEENTCRSTSVQNVILHRNQSLDCDHNNDVPIDSDS